MIFCFLISGSLEAQNKVDLSKGRIHINGHVNAKNYVAPKDSLVNQNLEKWKGYKIGLLITWGVYTQWGIIDSWTLCSYDAGWNHRTGPYANDYEEYKKQYERIYTYFNPTYFDPDVWAQAFKYAGVKYVIAMTKHLDGFCMYNTETTDYRITSPNCPFHTNPKSNVVFEICEAVRRNGMSAGAYFSKPDWNVNSFWWRYFGVKWLDVNYDTYLYPERWRMYKKFVYDQLDEITRTLGKLDILWLDGSWVRPNSNMDINMDTIAPNVRKNQPGILMVDRTCGQYEDYLTPEFEIPAEPLGVPWEVVRPLGWSWGHVPGAWYYTTDSLVHTLVEVVAKGGNILWGIGPDSSGRFVPDCYNRLQGLGEWMEVNNKAIYETSYTTPFKSGNVYFTTKQDTVFAIYISHNNSVMPSIISWDGIKPVPGSNVYLLGYNSPLTWDTDSLGVTRVSIPYSLQVNPPCLNAWSFQFLRLNEKRKK